MKLDVGGNRRQDYAMRKAGGNPPYLNPSPTAALLITLRSAIGPEHTSRNFSEPRDTDTAISIERLSCFGSDIKGYRLGLKLISQ